MTNYSTISAIRSEAGLTNNENIEVALIKAYQNKATSIVKSMVSRRYSLSAMATNFSGSQAEAYLQRCEELIAAGNLLTKEYGYEEDGTPKGKYKVDEAMEMLKGIMSGDMILLDSNDTEYASASTGSIIQADGYPLEADSTNVDGDSTARSFTLSQNW